MNKAEAQAHPGASRNVQAALTKALEANTDFIAQQKEEAQRLGVGLRGYVHESGIINVVQAEDVAAGELVWHPDLIPSESTQ